MAERCRKQEQARQTLEARADPIVRARLDAAFDRLQLKDPTGNTRSAIARYPLDVVLAAIATGSGPEKYIVALGYAGWGGGQLEGEMLANAWLSVSADTDIVFDLPVRNRFDSALGRLGIRVDQLLSDRGSASTTTAIPFSSICLW